MKIMSHNIVLVSGAIMMSVVPMVQAGSEFGAKTGYQVYANQENNPSTLGYGFFFSTPLREHWALESGVLMLGEAKESGRNVGAFNVAELSGVYRYELTHGHHIFGKIGAAPWFGYMESPSHMRTYDYGVSPTVGAGYSFPLFGQVFGRVEYQYTPKLGSDIIGYSDSHFLTLGFSWRPSRVDKEHTASRSIAGHRKPISPTGDFLEQGGVLVTVTPQGRELYGSWYFDNNSFELNLSTSLPALDRVRQWLGEGCQLQSITVQGYSDNTGTEQYNQWLSQQRAQRVGRYLSTAMSYGGEVTTTWHGHERLAHQPKDSNHYERRVDFSFRFSCQGDV